MLCCCRQVLYDEWKVRDLIFFFSDLQLKFSTSFFSLGKEIGAEIGGFVNLQNMRLRDLSNLKKFEREYLFFSIWIYFIVSFKTCYFLRQTNCFERAKLSVIHGKIFFVCCYLQQAHCFERTKHSVIRGKISLCESKRRILLEVSDRCRRKNANQEDKRISDVFSRSPEPQTAP